VIVSPEFRVSSEAGLLAGASLLLLADEIHDNAHDRIFFPRSAFRDKKRDGHESGIGDSRDVTS
jgi:hypothetical protein